MDTTQPKVKIYTTATCVYCRGEKQFLDSKGVKYDIVAADESQAAAEELYKVSGQLGVPFTIVTKADGAQETILGFDQSRLTQVLGL